MKNNEEDYIDFLDWVLGLLNCYKKFSYRFKDKYELKKEHNDNLNKGIKENKNSRSIASISNESSLKRSKAVDPSWIVLILGLIALGFGVVRFKINEK